MEADLQVRPLLTGEESAVLDFLNHRPVRNVTMLGPIIDHGLQSPHHRGAFYGCLREGRLIGVALIGYCTQLSGPGWAAAAFANYARLTCGADIRLVIGGEGEMKAFCRVLTAEPCSLRVQQILPQVFFILSRVEGEADKMPGLSLAREGEAEEVTQCHARLCMELNGIDPLALDPEGCRRRVLSRIRRGRVWTVCDAQGVAFKADVMAETEDAAYLEGIWTRPDLRGRGLGRAVLKDLVGRLLGRHHAVCLFAEARDERLCGFYRGLGFTPIASYCVARLDLLG